MIKYVDETGKNVIQCWCTPDEKTREQLENLANHPRIYCPVALMPDGHMGYGMPIGGVVAVYKAIIPNAVGADIGCGVTFFRTNVKFTDLNSAHISFIWKEIKEQIPVGFHKNKEPYAHSFDVPVAWMEEHKENLRYQLGTLGGGNHFIEIQVDSDGYLCCMLHSGSRNIGKQIGDYYNLVAKALHPEAGDLAWLEFDDEDEQEMAYEYEACMKFALDYAQMNRAVMMSKIKTIFRRILGSFDIEFTFTHDIHHNYAVEVEPGIYLHRKGATSAAKDQIGLIPGSMGTASYVVRGLGNPLSYESCSHGAGRVKGRNDATRTLDSDSESQKMEGILFDGWKFHKRGSIKGMEDLGEAPGAYKDIDDVMDAQTDLVQAISKLRPVAVIKG